MTYTLLQRQNREGLEQSQRSDGAISSFRLRRPSLALKLTYRYIASTMKQFSGCGSQRQNTYNNLSRCSKLSMKQDILSVEITVHIITIRLQGLDETLKKWTFCVTDTDFKGVFPFKGGKKHRGNIVFVIAFYIRSMSLIIICSTVQWRHFKTAMCAVYGTVTFDLAPPLVFQYL